MPLPRRHPLSFPGLLALGLLGPGAPALAAEMSPADEARIKAGIILDAFDELDRRCTAQGGFSDAQSTEADRWRSDQQVDRVRAHLDAQGLSAPVRQQVRAAAAQLVRQVASATDPCVAAVSLTRTAEARFAGQLPLILPAGAKVPAPATAATAASPKPATRGAPPAPAAPARDSGQTARLATEIEGFAFDSCTRMGYGGMILLVPCPVVLFKSGAVLTEVEELGEVRTAAAHQQAHPQSWTRWRREGGRLQLLKDEGWENLQFTTLYSALPAGFKLDGRFRSTSGTGNTAMGGGEAVVVWSDYVFTPDGRVRRDGGAGASSSSTGTSVTSASQAAARTGRYRIEGLVLAIDYDDGGRERRVIIADPKDQGRGTMWLDGEGYVVRK